MAIKLKIRKGDTVQVIAGSQKGDKGTVLEVNRNDFKIRVQGIRVQTHFDKKEGKYEEESYIDYSNVKLVEKAAAAAKKKTKKKTAAKA